MSSEERDKPNPLPAGTITNGKGLHYRPIGNGWLERVDEKGEPVQEPWQNRSRRGKGKPSKRG